MARQGRPRVSAGRLPLTCCTSSREWVSWHGVKWSPLLHLPPADRCCSVLNMDMLVVVTSPAERSTVQPPSPALPQDKARQLGALRADRSLAAYLQELGFLLLFQHTRVSSLSLDREEV